MHEHESAKAHALSVYGSEFPNGPEVCFEFLLCVVHLRRGIYVEDYQEQFQRLLNNKIDELIPALNTRWLVSLCGTIADFGTDLERANAMNVTAIVNMTKFTDSYLDNVRDKSFQLLARPSNTRIIWDGIWSFNIVEGDMVENLFGRINEVTKSTPAVHKIWREVIKRMQSGNNAIANLQTHHTRGYFTKCQK